jgi:hypothetical protein
MMKMERSMIKDKNISKYFWAKVVSCSVYILNRYLIGSVKDKVPQEAWNGMKKSVSHAITFGCRAYAHVP